jgi:di/tricarboxylate transporter
MPIGMCAILGGTMTMIGTSPLILLNDILPPGMEKFSLLELTPIGLGFVIMGILYFATAGRYFLKKISEDQEKRMGGGQVEEVTDVRTIYHDLDGPFELAVPLDFHPGELPTTVVEIRRRFLVNIIGIADARGMHELAPVPNMKVRGGHQLCVYGPEKAIREFAEHYEMKVLDRPRRFGDLFNPAVAGTVEAVVSPRSQMIGATVHEIGFRRTFGLTLLALYREGRVYYREMSDIPMKSGDALLLHSTWERFRVFQRSHRHFRIMTALEEIEIQKPGRAKAAIAVFAVTLALMLVSSFYFQTKPYNPIPLSVCLMAGGLGMVLTGVMSIRDAYHAIDWRTVFLLGGLIPLGMAVDGTGTAEWIASGVVTALGDFITPLVLLTILAVMSGCFCLVMSNVGACTLLVPLGVSMASQIGIDPRVAAIVVGLGVSNSFFLPTHQVNALYMGPGDYRTKDYMRIGGVLSVMYVIVLVTMTYLFYL